MKNSMLLRLATGLCVANVFLALWSSWTMSSVRSRLAVVEAAIRHGEKDVEALRASLASEAASRESGLKDIDSEVKAMSLVLDRFLRPQPKAK